MSAVSDVAGLVERLRTPAMVIDPRGAAKPIYRTPDALEAADALERQAALIEALRTPPAPTEAVAWRFKFAAAPSWSYRDEHPAADWADQCRLLQPLYTHPPQPDALPGDMREKVAQIIEAAIERHNPGNSLRHTIDEADAILSLIQSERGGA